MATNKTRKTKKPTDWIRDFRTKYAGTCNRAVMARRAERAREYIARTPCPDRATVRRIMAGKCAVIFPADAKPAKTLDTATLKKLCVSAERLKFSNGPSAKF